MTEIAFETVDVFTDVRFGGNQLAVIADARGLGSAEMQHIAAEFNYSETAFVLPPKDARNTAHVRIFTPREEIPFAGHPNVGTGFTLAQQPEVFGQVPGAEMRFEETAGIVGIEILHDRGTVVGAAIAAAADIENGAHDPLIASVGAPFLIAEVKDQAALGRAEGVESALLAWEARYPIPGDRLAVFAYCRDGTAEFDYRARMFAPLNGIPEDPATGSANGVLGGLLCQLAPARDLVLNIRVGQGIEIARPSLIEVRAEKAGGRAGAVVIAGRCVPVMSGRLTLP